ncbi:MAG: hypothetical protein KDD19_29565 [Phaeodactylibacter sp.]|nr:hypothetical protein [Phaeodactylibacter sp.]MCB9053342.1 hypothetical protein [Lewinellaceae bacterium]
MKTVLIFLLPLFFLSCQKGASLDELPDNPGAAPLVRVDTPTASAACPHPEYDPPDMVPGTNCIDPCQFVYEGWVDFDAGVLEVNCQSRPLSSPALSFSIDSTIVRHVGLGFLKVLRIQAPGIGAWCSARAFFRVEGCPPPERTFLFIGHDEVSEYRVVWPPGFWECAAGKRIHFRIIARQPLALGNDSHH